MITDAYPAKLVVTPDNSTPGSEGRLYLLFPEEMAGFVGLKFKPCGSYKDGAILLVAAGVGLTITPRLQMWWKNGVRDHGIRENWEAVVYVLKNELLVVELTRRTGEPAPVLPPSQQTLF